MAPLTDSMVDETRGIGVGQRAEDDLLDDGEHGGVDADAEAEGDDGGEGEGGGLSELSQGETKVLGQRGHADLLQEDQQL